MVSVFALYAFAGEVAVTFCDDAIARVERFPNDPRPDAGSLAVVLRPQGVAAERSESAAERTWRAKDMPKIWKFEALQDRPRLFVLTDLYCMEGDTPSFLGLIANGLGWTESPAYGGWGGRYEWRTPESESHPIWTTPEVKDELKGMRSPGYSITRWREGYQLDFAGRMKWSVTPKYEDANHNPVAVLNGDRTKGVVRIAAKRGDKVALSAEGSSDPDGDSIACEWSVYREAGTLAGGDLRADGARAVLDLSAIPEGSSGSLHVILRVRDSGSPRLFAYRRAIVEVGHIVHLGDGRGVVSFGKILNRNR